MIEMSCVEHNSKSYAWIALGKFGRTVHIHLLVGQTACGDSPLRSEALWRAKLGDELFIEKKLHSSKPSYETNDKIWLPKSCPSEE